MQKKLELDFVKNLNIFLDDKKNLAILKKNFKEIKKKYIDNGNHHIIIKNFEKNPKRISGKIIKFSKLFGKPLKQNKLGQKFVVIKPNVKLIHSNSNKHVLRFNLTEGKNREIRNICTLFNLKVERLKRISYGRFLLKSITYGEYKELEVNESYQR